MKELEGQIRRLTAKSYHVKKSESPVSTIQHFGRMPGATSSARITGPCGETMEIYLKIADDCIRDISFFTDGCGASLVCGAVAVDLAKGRSIDQAILVEGDTILAALPELPDDHHHCAHLAAQTLQTAIHNYVALPEHRHHLAAPPGDIQEE